MASQKPRFLEDGFRGFAVGRDLRIGDGEAAHAAGLGQPCQAFEPLIDRERRALRREDHQPADGVHGAGIARQSRGGQLIRELLVCREEQLEGRAVPNLPRQRSRGAEHQLDARPSGARERVGDLVQREIQVRGGGDRGRLLRGAPCRPPRGRSRWPATRSTSAHVLASVFIFASRVPRASGAIGEARRHRVSVHGRHLAAILLYCGT